MQGNLRLLARYGRLGFILFTMVVLLSACMNDSGQSSAAKASPDEEEPVFPRIVSTTVAITEIMDLLEVDLVGVPTSIKKLPDRYDGVDKVGSPMSPDMELVRLLKPDEVLSVTTLKYDLSPKYESAGIQADFLDLTSLENMNETILKLGLRYGREEQAERVARQYREKMEEMQAATAGKPAPTVLILMGIPGSYLVATEYSYIGDLVKSLGGINIVQGEQVEYVASNTEHLQQANPDVILRAAHGLPDEVVKMFDKEFRTNDIWKHFNAVKTGRVYDLEESRFGMIGNMAVSDALDDLIGMLYE
jgi:iron complex transport system substrate-binding protein